MKLATKTIVKKLAMLTLAVAGITGTTQAFGQEYVNVPVATASSYQPRTPADLQQLTAPLALYPDALLAQVFVASTYPNDVLAAAQYLQNGGDPNQAANFGWDASVQGLLQTPDVLNQLAGNVDYMNQLGDAFLNQQDDVFAAVQALRAKAQACGNLVTTAQEQVVASDNAIQILPTNPDVIYVPVYDPAVVYVTRRVDFYNPCITFGAGIRVGFWLHDDFDWHDRRVYVGDWGGDRPWWHADRADYVRNRPGVYINNVTNVNIRNTTTVWNHDNRKAGPVHVQGPVINRITNVTNRANVINSKNVTDRTNIVTNNTNVNRTNVNVNRTNTSVNHTQATNLVHTNRTETTGRTQTQRTSATMNRTSDVSRKTVAVNHVQQPTNHANAQSHTAQPNPVRQPAARQLPTHAQQSVATAQRTQTVNHSAAQMSRNTTQMVSHTASASRTNGNQRSNTRRG